jgi:hypothetical protein
LLIAFAAAAALSVRQPLATADPALATVARAERGDIHALPDSKGRCPFTTEAGAFQRGFDRDRHVGRPACQPQPEWLSSVVAAQVRWALHPAALAGYAALCLL